MEVLADLKAPPPLGPADVLLSVRFVCRDGRTGLNTWEFTMWGNVDLVATVSRSSKAVPWEETHRGCRARVEGVWPYPENWVHQVFATAGTEYEVVARREDRDTAQPSGRYVLAPMATVIPEAEGAQLLPGSFGLPPRLAVLQASVGSGSVEWVAPTELEVHVVEEAPWLFAGIFEVTRKGLARVLSVIAASGYRLAVATPEGRYTFVAPAEPELRPKSSDWDMDIQSLPRLLDRRRNGDVARKRGGSTSGTEDPACSTSEGSSVSHETFQSEKVRTELCRDSSSTALSGRSTKSERLCPKVLRLMSTKAACDRESERAVGERDGFRELVRAQDAQKEKVVETQDATATLIARIRELERALREAEAERVRHAEARRQAEEAHAEESTTLRALVAQLEEQVSAMPPWPVVRTRDVCNAVEASRHILIDCPGVNEDDIDISGLPNGVRVRIERSEAGAGGGLKCADYTNTSTSAPCPVAMSTRPQLPGNRSLQEADPVIHGLVQEEKQRQMQSIELIASENFTSRAVMECLGSVLTNKYSEGQPNARYYGGNEVIDKIENLCKERALTAFGLDEKQWGVNVQPYSGSPANFAVYTALLTPHSRVMGLGLPSGGHLTHGYYTAKKKISATSIYFESLPYSVHPETGIIEYEELRKQALIFRPAMILCGASAYPRTIDFARFRAIADEVGAILMADIAHISGLVATKQHPSPFEHCDVVTTTTHKSLRGPRAGMIFFKYSEAIPDIKERIDMAVFPALQGGPHNHQIGALAAQLLEVNTPEFVEYSKAVVANAGTLAEALIAKGHKLASGGTDNHLVLWDLRPHGLTGSKVEKVCEAASISLNRNTVPGDASALSPGGVRIGSPAMTTRGCTTEDFKRIADFLDRCASIALDIQKEKGKKLKDFEEGLKESKAVLELRKDVQAFSLGFGYPGL